MTAKLPNELAGKYKVADISLAEWGRKEIRMAEKEMPVNDIVGRLGWPQPMVSKHLGVLKEVGLVTARRDGRQRLYRVNGERLKTIHDWAKMFEKFWSHQLLRIKERAERKAKEQSH